MKVTKYEIDMLGVGAADAFLIHFFDENETQYVYSLVYENGDKDDYVKSIQDAYKNQTQLKVEDYTLGKDSVLMEFVQTATKNDAVIKLMKEEFESIEVVRGGSVGIESISMMER